MFSLQVIPISLLLILQKKNTQTVNRMAENDYPGNNLLLVKMEKKVTEE